MVETTKKDFDLGEILMMVKLYRDKTLKYYDATIEGKELLEKEEKEFDDAKQQKKLEEKKKKEEEKLKLEKRQAKIQEIKKISEELNKLKKRHNELWEEFLNEYMEDNFYNRALVRSLLIDPDGDWIDNFFII